MNKSVAIVSPHFPPSALAGVHRARHLSKHLPKHGWRPIIIRASSRFYTERLDPGLAALVPPNVTQILTGALPARLTRYVGVGDIGLRGFFHFKSALSQVSAQETLGVVLITGSPFYPMLLAPWIRRHLGVPVVLDFQDPWVSAWGAGLPRFSKGGMAHLLATVSESHAVRNAAWITSVSNIQNEQMASRYHWIDRTRMSAIPIGGDPQDFEILRNEHGASRANSARQEIELAFVGSVWPRLQKTLDVFLEGVAEAARIAPLMNERVKIRFYGTDARLTDPPIFQVAALAEDKSVSHIVKEHPRRLPYLDALAAMSRADGLILLGSDEAHYTASKIYPALMSHRPFLSVFHAASSAHAVLSRAGGGAALSFTDGNEGRLKAAISTALVRLAFQPESFGENDGAAYEEFTASSMAGCFAEIFNRLAAEGP